MSGLIAEKIPVRKGWALQYVKSFGRQRRALKTTYWKILRENPDGSWAVVDRALTRKKARAMALEFADLDLFNWEQKDA